MNARLLAASTLVAAALQGAVPVGAAPLPTDWPQFLGPQRNGTSASKGLAREWPAGGPFVVWKRPLGSGFSGIAVAEGRVYTSAAEGDKDWALCFDAASGQELWRREIGPRFVGEFGDGPISTPTVTADTVYIASAQAVLHALDVKDGAVRWSVDLLQAFGGQRPRFGYAPSPLLDGDQLVIDAGGKEGKSLVGLDAKTGAVRWTSLDGPATYASPVEVTVDGTKQYLAVRYRPAELVSLSPQGQVLWRHPIPFPIYTAPVFLAPDRIFLSTSEQEGGVMLQVAAGAASPTITPVWTNRLLRTHYQPVVQVGEHLYGFDNATLKAISVATGQQAWAYRGFGKGSVLAADGLLYVLSDRGVLALVEASPTGYTEKGRAQVLQGRSWTAPALAGTRLFVRDQDEILCLEVGPPAPPALEPDPNAVSAQT